MGNKSVIYLKKNLIYNGKYIKAKISLYNATFYGNKTLRENKHYNSLSVMLLDSVANVQKRHYPHF